jgi:integrase
VASITRRSGEDRWQARFRDQQGREHSRRFDRKTDARRWLDEQSAALVTGQFVDPRAGRVTVREYAEQWRAAQAHRPTTRAHVETMMRLDVYPTFGERSLSSIRLSQVQAWATSLPLQPATVRVAYTFVAQVFKAAVRDRLIASSPCEGISLPRVQREPVVPLTTEQVQALADAVPERWRALVILAAGTGLRQGECLGLTVDRVDWLRRTVRVDRQLTTLPGSGPLLAPPKTAASVRIAPGQRLARHVRHSARRTGRLVRRLPSDLHGSHVSGLPVTPP